VIFVTVGAQMPFDRMCQAVDQWAAKRQRPDVFAQIGSTDWRPTAMKFTPMIDPPAFKKAMQECSVVVAHAGMGSILTALQYGKPILVMPRRGDLRETRNDHQIATAKRFKELGRVAVAFDEAELERELDRLGELRATERISPWASDELLNAVRAFVHGGVARAASVTTDSPQRTQRAQRGHRGGTEEKARVVG
jgi:UDP-N-acetylglucosamine transferase subunit ALG13